MIKVKVYKMGNQRYVNVSCTNLKMGSRVFLKPKGIDFRVLRRVVKHGDRKIVIVPKDYWEFFKHTSDVYVIKKGKSPS